MLVLEIDFLLGLTFMGKNQESSEVDWPPQPDRIYSALVAAWAYRGKDLDERHALEWLEHQPTPVIVAGAAPSRVAPVSFVPPNDFRASTTTRLDVIPARRMRQPRRFPGGALDDTVVRIIWASGPTDAVQRQLDNIARDVAYVGHSAALTRCRFLADPCDCAGAVPPKRTVYPGRLEELERAFARGARPRPGADVAGVGLPTAALPESLFSERWVVLADAGAGVPDIRAIAIVARKLRNALMGASGDEPSEVPEWLSGHDSNGLPSAKPHLAIVPMADIGWKYSDGRLLGCALVMPRSLSPDLLDDPIRRLLAAGAFDSEGSRVIELHYGAKDPWLLLPTESPILASQNPLRWIGLPPKSNGPSRSAEHWVTATPIVLDRFPKARTLSGRTDEVASIISNACVNIGLPRPLNVIWSVSSNLRGIPPAAVPKDLPSWQRWQMPDSCKGRPLAHARLEFAEPIRGPVIIGAGRYVGLGLCLPVHPDGGRK